MPNETNYLDITLLGKEYRVACPPSEHAALLAAVTYVDEKMHDIAEKTKSNISERIAVMAALNIAHEHLTHLKQPGESRLGEATEIGLDKALVMRKIADMETELDAVLAPQGKLL